MKSVKNKQFHKQLYTQKKSRVIKNKKRKLDIEKITTV